MSEVIDIETTIETIKTMTAMPTIFNLLIVPFNMVYSGCRRQDGTATCLSIVGQIPLRQPQPAWREHGL